VALAVEHAGHEPAERRGQSQHDREEQQNLKPAIEGHQNFSGRSSA